MTDQFQRLVETQTVSSLARRIATKVQKSPPPDALDLALASTYDHHAVWGAARANVVKQEYSCVANHAGEYRTGPPNNGSDRREDAVTVKPYESRTPYRNYNYHVELGIPPHHASNSRRGYGRGPDGCFYST